MKRPAAGSSMLAAGSSSRDGKQPAGTDAQLPAPQLRSAVSGGSQIFGFRIPCLQGMLVRQRAEEKFPLLFGGTSGGDVTAGSERRLWRRKGTRDAAIASTLSVGITLQLASRGGVASVGSGAPAAEEQQHLRLLCCRCSCGTAQADFVGWSGSKCAVCCA